MTRDIRMALPDMDQQSQGNLLTHIFLALGLNPSDFNTAEDASQALLHRIRDLRAHEGRLRIDTDCNGTDKHEPGEISGHFGMTTDVARRKLKEPEETGQKPAEQERERLQAQLLQAQKMESMGVLAGGVAHDFNNLLQAMSGNVELLLHGKPDDHPDTIRLQRMAKAMDRGAQLVRQLLLFSRKTGSRRMRVDLNQEIENLVRMLERTIPKMIALELRLDPSIWPLFADPVQIEQVLLNLAGNAVDAMPEGGKLTLETSNVVLDTAFVAAHPGSSPGHHVLVTVTDTGCGMDEETLAHVFDPFFTTKEIGKGTGLGLASAYGIIKAHGGFIHCSSVPGLGTMFRVYWPTVDVSNISPKSEPEARSPLQGGRETVLVVDDEQAIRELTREALETLGYTVKCAATGEEALAVFQEYAQKIDLVLLDLNMPGMGGKKCLHELLRITPAIKVIISSGLSAGGHLKDLEASGARGFIGKPYQFRDLALKLRQVLES